MAGKTENQKTSRLLLLILVLSWMMSHASPAGAATASPPVATVKSSAPSAPAAPSVPPAPAPAPAVGMPSTSVPASGSVNLAPAPSPVVAPDAVWTMNDVLRIARERNPDILSAKANYEAASKVVGESVSGYLPQITVSGEDDRTTLPTPGNASTTNGLALPYAYAGVAIRQTLFDFGKNLNKIQSSSALGNAAAEQRVAVQEVVDLSVRKAFYNVSATEKLEEVAEKNLAQVQETHRRTELLVSTGARPEFDLTQANVQLAQAKVGVIDAQAARDLAKVALLQLMGVERQITFTIQESQSDVPKIASSQLQLGQLRSLALDARPEMKQAGYNVESANDLVSAQVKNFLPTLDANAWYDHFLPNYPDSLRNAWGIGLSATWNVLDGLYTPYRLGELQARRDQQEDLKTKEGLEIISEVESSYKDLVRSESNEKAANEGFEAATENLRLAQQRYEANVSTILELLIAESSLVNAEASVIQARYSRAIALATLQQAVYAPLPVENK